MSASCVECGRTFNLLTDGAEIAHGHDCQPTPQSYTVYDLPYYSSPVHMMEEQT